MLTCFSTAQARTKCAPRSVQRSCHEVSYINLAKRTLLESLYRGFIQRSCTETLHRDLLKSCQEAPYRDLAKRPLIEILYRDLARTPLMETLCRHCIEILLQRSCQEVSYINLAQRATCISTARARTKCVSAFWAHSGLRHVTCKFLYEVALLQC